MTEFDTWEPSPSHDNDLTDDCWYGWCDQCRSGACSHACHDPDGPPLWQSATPITAAVVRDQLL